MPIDATTPPIEANERPNFSARDAAVLNWRFGKLEAEELLRIALRQQFPGRIAVVTSFGADSAVLLDMVAKVDPATPVIFLETGKHFDETLEYRDALVARLGLTDVRSVKPKESDLERDDPDGRLWRSDTDRCCHLRKVLPLARALEGFDAWVTGRKQYQGGERAELAAIEAVDGRIKLNPLHDWDYGAVRNAFDARGLPDHPLIDYGYLSIGCSPCTEPVRDGDDIRSGRWALSAKTECGIHRVDTLDEPGDRRAA